MKTENTLINTLKDSIPLTLRRNNSPLVQKLLNNKAKKEGFVNWEHLCNENRKEILKIQQLRELNKKNTPSILRKFEHKNINNIITNTLLIENNLHLNNEIIKQKINNKETIIIVADLNESDWSHLLNALETEQNRQQLNIISDSFPNPTIKNQTFTNKETREIFLTEYINAHNIRDFILDMMDINSAWSNKPMLLFSSYWLAMSYKMNQNQSLEFEELKDMIQFNKYFELYQELKNNPHCPKPIWLSMENFLRGIPQININTKEQQPIVHEQYGYIQMQIMRLINNLLMFEKNTSQKQFNTLFNDRQITIFNIHSEQLNKKEFNLRLYIYLIHVLYKNLHEELIRKNRKITFNFINVLHEKAIDKFFYLNNDYLSIIGTTKEDEAHSLLKDNFQIVIKESE